MGFLWEGGSRAERGEEAEEDGERNDVNFYMLLGKAGFTKSIYCVGVWSNGMVIKVIISGNGLIKTRLCLGNTRLKQGKSLDKPLVGQ